MKTLNHFLSLTFLSAMPFVARAALTDGLVSYWPLDVINTATTPDATFTNTLGINGGVTAGSAGQVSNQFTFNGTSGYICITNASATSYQDSGLPVFSAGAYTICMW